MSYQVKTPVIMSIFHRPEWIKQVFDQVAKARPSKLFLFADGARENRPQEKKACQEALNVVENIDWDCEVHRNYSEVNLGNRKRISSGINWAFEHVDEAIFLEHDCLPGEDFFRFMDEMLDRYRNSDEIMTIAGFNPFGKVDCKSDYLFSKYGNSWGWATWKKNWQLYDPYIQNWPKNRRQKDPYNGFLNKDERNVMSFHLDCVYKNDVDAWDYPWDYCRFLNNKLFIIPRVSLIQNIGFDPDSENTKDTNNPMIHIKACKLDFPLKHPEKINRDTEFEKRHFSIEGGKIIHKLPYYRLKKRIKWMLKRFCA